MSRAIRAPWRETCAFCSTAVMRSKASRRSISSSTPRMWRRSPCSGAGARLGLDVEADWAAQPRPAQTAIAVRHLGQVLLVVVFSEVKRRDLEDLGRDGPVAVCRQNPLVGLLGSLGRASLSRGVDVDAGSILGADVVALSHALRGIMAFPEGFEQRLVADFLGIEHHQYDFVVARAAGAYFLIGRVGCGAAGVAHRRDPNAIAHLPELALGTPEAAEPEHRRLEALWIGTFEGALVEEVCARRRDWLRAAFEGIVGGRYFEVLAGKEHGFEARRVVVGALDIVCN